MTTFSMLPVTVPGNSRIFSAVHSGGLNQSSRNAFDSWAAAATPTRARLRIAFFGPRAWCWPGPFVPQEFAVEQREGSIPNWFAVGAFSRSWRKGYLTEPLRIFAGLTFCFHCAAERLKIFDLESQDGCQNL
jgi:hypothetical protein